MSGHSKWHSIRHKKGANDAKRGKIFTKHANLITIAARSGGDPDMNPALRLALDNAKRENMPNANIERAIKKGTGEDKDAAQMHEMTYEGYGPNGIAIFVEALTDNKNRTLTNVRTAFGKNGGNMGESGSVGYMFHKKGLIFITNGSEDLELAAIEADVEDVELDGEMMTVTTAFADLYSVRDTMEAAGAIIEKAEHQLIADTHIVVSDIENAKKVMRLIEAIEDDDDVTSVASNADISTTILEQL